jgi:adenylate cyclase
MSENKDNAYFADGVQEDLLTDLANIRELKVISRTSVMRYRDTTKTIHQIAAELGVAFIFEGSVRHSGDRIRVTGQLINASTDEHIWAKTYDRDLIDIFAVQTDLSHEIATALQAVLTPQENIRLEMRPTKSVAAYELYQQAMAVVSKGVAHVSLEQALPLLERAVEIDPSYAKAWVQIYWLQDFAYWHENRPASRLASMRDAIAHAEQADRNDFDVLFAAANLGGAIDDRAMVGHYRQQIVELYPNRAEAYLVLADTAVDEGRRKDAWAAYENARALDPLNKGVLSSLDFFLLINRRYARAEEIEQAIVQLDPEDNDAALRLASTPFFRTGSTLELKSLLARLPEDLEMKDPVIRTSRFRVMVELGDSEGMIRLWQKSGGNVTAVAPNRQVRMLMAATYLERNDVASARTLLQQSRDDAQAQLVGNPTMLDAVNDLGLALAMLGDQEGAKAKLAQAQDILNRLAPGQEVEARFESILVRAWTGEKAKVIADLAQMMRSPLMGEARLNVHGLRVFQLMLPLRGDPAFEVVLNDPANNAPLF